jgi:hypothetical protein
MSKIIFKKPSILALVGLSFLFFQLSSPCDAMDQDPEDVLLKTYFQKKKEQFDKVKDENNQLIEANNRLSSSLKEADDLIEYLIKAPPTVHSYLSAVFNQVSTKEEEELLKTATKGETIRDIIVEGHTKFKSDSPDAHRKLLKVTGLLQNMKVSETYETVSYGSVSIPPSPEKSLIEKKKALINSKTRYTKPLFQLDQQEGAASIENKKPSAKVEKSLPNSNTDTITSVEHFSLGVECEEEGKHDLAVHHYDLAYSGGQEANNEKIFLMAP